MKSTEYMIDIIEESKYATGIDVSHWKGMWDISDVQMNRLRTILDFVILRIGYGAQSGTVVKDKQFEARYKVLEELPEIIRGAYWYMSSHSSITKQLDAMENYIGNKEFDFIVLDTEGSYNEKSSTFAHDIVRMLYYMKDRFPNMKVMIYANKYFYNDWIRRYTTGADKFPLWIAQYPWKSWVITLTDYFKNYWYKVFGSGEYAPGLPGGHEAEDWEIVQLIDASGLGHELGFDSDMVDFNRSRRTKEKFIEWLFDGKLPARWGDAEPEPEPQPEEPFDCENEIKDLKNRVTNLENK